MLGALVACRPDQFRGDSSLDNDGEFNSPGDGPDGETRPPSPREVKVRINELMAINTGTLADRAGDFPPWIELYNPTDAVVDLAGMALSDDLLLASKWTIPDVPEAVIEPFGFVVIFCDGDTENDQDLHANFRLEPAPFQLVFNKGSDLFFFNGSDLKPDQSAGRSPDGAEELSILSAPSPGAGNAPPAPPAEGSFLRGDANGDGRVNVSDITGVVGVLFDNLPLPECQDRLDANDDGRGDVADALYIGQALYRHGPAFPPPFPRPGVDPTGDGLPCPGD